MVRSSAIAIQQARHTNEVGPSSDAPGSERRPFDRTPGSLEGDPWRKYWRSFIGGGKPPSALLKSAESSP